MSGKGKGKKGKGREGKDGTAKARRLVPHQRVLSGELEG